MKSRPGFLIPALILATLTLSALRQQTPSAALPIMDTATPPNPAKPTTLATPTRATPTQTPTSTFTATPTETAPPTPTMTLSPTMPPPLPTIRWPNQAMSTPQPPKRSILVSQARQMMYVCEEDTVVRSIPVSTGRPTSRTLTRAWNGKVGDDRGHRWLNESLQADYMWFLFKDLYGNILIHSVPYIRQGDAKTYDQLDALGVRPTSRGCIRISPQDAAWLKRWNPVGVEIQITGWPGPVRQVTGDEDR